MQVLHNSSLEKFKKFLTLKNYSANTISMYVSYVTIFLNKFNASASSISNKEIQNFLNTYSYTSISNQNTFYSAIKLFYHGMLGRKLTLRYFSRPRKVKKLPRIINHDELLKIINSIPNIKHKTIIYLAYSTGMRISEICNVMLTDIDSKRMLILIRSGKGRKDRYVPMSKSLLDQLQSYYSNYKEKPKTYLFESYNIKYSTSSCRAIWNKYKTINTNFHTIRHSCFTRLLETGTDIRIIQKIAGHSNIKTTEIYTHVSNDILNKVEMPI